VAEIISSFTSDYKPNTPQMSSSPFIQCCAFQKPPQGCGKSVVSLFCLDFPLLRSLMFKI